MPGAAQRQNLVPAKPLQIEEEIKMPMKKPNNKSKQIRRQKAPEKKEDVFERIQSQF